jgi:hypothetical protein
MSPSTARAATANVRSALCERQPQPPLSSSALSAEAAPASATFVPLTSITCSSLMTTAARTQEPPLHEVGKFVVKTRTLRTAAESVKGVDRYLTPAEQ